MAWDPSDLIVNPGQLVRPIFNKFLEYLLAWRILSGKGTLLTQTSQGMIVNARAWVIGFKGAFYVSLLGTNRVQVALGIVADGMGNNFEPTINGVPISGDGAQPPQLAIGAAGFANGISYIALAAVFNPSTGSITNSAVHPAKPLGLTIVQTPTTTPKASVYYYPLALLRLDASGNISKHQIVYFDLEHSVSRSQPSGPLVHYFDSL